ncbi:MAG TPA: hypothetical protein VHY79_04865 [Rhizomicrobium sp.]|jgi:hypothetical protein|nr:hypothetical protein [Rhizomicrobium sp.]
MAENDQSVCQICDEPFEVGDLVIVYREWPGEERPGHVGCVGSISMIDEEDDEDE